MSRVSPKDLRRDWMTQWQAKRAEKRQYWEEQIRRWRESGLTQISYCSLNKINRHRLVYWRKRLSAGVSPSSLVEISLNRPPHDENLPESPLRLLIGMRYRIEVARGFDPGVLYQLIYVLEQR
jgi:hypothetical protein